MNSDERPADLDALLNAFQSAPSAELREEAALALRAQADVSCWRRLFGLWIDDRTALYRSWACELAERFGDRAVAGHVDPRRWDQDALVRAAAERAMARIRADSPRVPFWLRWLRPAGVFASIIFFLVPALAWPFLGFEIVSLAFPFSLIRPDRSEIWVPGWMPNAAWCVLAAVFGVIASRIHPRWLLLIAPLAVVVCLLLFKLVLRELGLTLRHDGL